MKKSATLLLFITFIGCILALNQNYEQELVNEADTIITLNNAQIATLKPIAEKDIENAYHHSVDGEEQWYWIEQFSDVEDVIEADQRTVMSMQAILKVIKEGINNVYHPNIFVPNTTFNGSTAEFIQYLFHVEDEDYELEHEDKKMLITLQHFQTLLQSVIEKDQAANEPTNALFNLMGQISIAIYDLNDQIPDIEAMIRDIKGDVMNAGSNGQYAKDKAELPIVMKERSHYLDIIHEDEAGISNLESEMEHTENPTRKSIIQNKIKNLKQNLQQAQEDFQGPNDIVNEIELELEMMECEWLGDCG